MVPKFCCILYMWFLNPCSVNCASIHRKMGTHISKVYVLRNLTHFLPFSLTLCLQEERNYGHMEQRTSGSEHLFYRSDIRPIDSWFGPTTKAMKQNGNLKSNAYYNPNEVRNPPPTNMIEQERDSELEKYIRSASYSTI